MQDGGAKKRQSLAFPREQQSDSKRRQHIPPPSGPQPTWTADVPRKRGRPRKSIPTPDVRPVNTNDSSQTKSRAAQNPTIPALVYKKGFDTVRRQQTFQHYQQYLQYGGRQPPTATPQPQPQPQPALPVQAPPTGFEYLALLNTEAQVRVALDVVHRSEKPASMKQRHMVALYHRLGQVHMQNGTRQS